MFSSFICCELRRDRKEPREQSNKELEASHYEARRHAPIKTHNCHINGVNPWTEQKIICVSYTYDVITYISQQTKTSH